MILILFVITSCKEDLVEPKPQGPIELSIMGTESPQMLTRDKNLVVHLDASASTGVDKYQWFKLDPENIKSFLGNNSSISDTILIAGKYDYELLGITQKDTVKKNYPLTILPPNFTNEIYFHEQTRFNPTNVILRYNLNTSSIDTVLEDETKMLSGNTLSKSPDGNYLIFGKIRGRAIDLYLYNILNKTEEKIQTTEGNSWQTAWNPAKDLVAFVDDSRYPNLARDELNIINPFTKELFRLASNDTIEEMEYFCGLYPSWNATGDEIALGLTYYNLGKRINGHDSLNARISIFSDLFNKPTRRPLHSDEYLVSYFKENYNVTMDPYMIDEGGNGVSWSPDGNKIAYNFFAYGLFDENTVAIANAHDGTIETIINIDNRPLAYPRWSPDSEHLTVNARTSNYQASEVYIVDKYGKNPVRISPNKSPNPKEVPFRTFGVSAWTQ